MPRKHHKRKNLKEELLKLYRYQFYGNTHTPEGRDIRLAIHLLELELQHAIQKASHVAHRSFY